VSGNGVKSNGVKTRVNAMASTGTGGKDGSPGRSKEGGGNSPGRGKKGTAQGSPKDGKLDGLGGIPSAAPVGGGVRMDCWAADTETREAMAAAMASRHCKGRSIASTAKAANCSGSLHKHKSSPTATTRTNSNSSEERGVSVPAASQIR